MRFEFPFGIMLAARLSPPVLRFRLIKGLETKQGPDDPTRPSPATIPLL
jgi:hypothetical protein